MGFVLSFIATVISQQGSKIHAPGQAKHCLRQSRPHSTGSQAAKWLPFESLLKYFVSLWLPVCCEGWYLAGSRMPVDQVSDHSLTCGFSLSRACPGELPLSEFSTLRHWCHVTCLSPLSVPRSGALAPEPGKSQYFSQNTSRIRLQVALHPSYCTNLWTHRAPAPGQTLPAWSIIYKTSHPPCAQCLQKLLIRAYDTSAIFLNQELRVKPSTLTLLTIYLPEFLQPEESFCIKLFKVLPQGASIGNSNLKFDAFL